MSININNILIICKSEGKGAFALGQKIAAWLENKGKNPQVLLHEQWIPKRDVRVNTQLPDLVLTLGGDGTFINVAATLIPMDIPFLGLNMGHLGFLTELTPENWQDNLSAIISGSYSMEKRLALGFRLIRDGGVVKSGIVVNDLVVSRGAMARLLKLHLDVDGEKLCSLRADGVIVSTPTGSTAYGVSAGGPILHPSLSAIAVTPVCPFLNEFRPQVLPGETVIAVSVEDSNGDSCLTADGQELTILEPGDRVEMFKSEHQLRLAVVKPHCYYQKLKTKGFVTGS